MAYKNTLLTGITDFLVLSILKIKGDCYAYEISKYITSESNKLLSISPNTIYTVMYKLENEHMISEYSVLVGKKRTRVYYHIEAIHISGKTITSNSRKSRKKIFGYASK